MRVKVIVEMSQEEMDRIKSTIAEYQLEMEPKELIMENVDTDFFDYLDFEGSEVRVVEEC